MCNILCICVLYYVVDREHQRDEIIICADTFYKYIMYFTMDSAAHIQDEIGK